MGVYEEWNRLTPAEKAYIATHPEHAVIIRSSKQTAFDETQRRFGRNGHNDESDAFRHCFWAAILARDLNYMNAYWFTTAHESDPNNDPTEREMDLHNNGVGLTIGRLFFVPLRTINPIAGPLMDVTEFAIGRLVRSNRTISDRCYSALVDGELRVMSPQGMP